MHVSIKVQMKGGCTHQDQTANDRRARQQFVSTCLARARVELRVFGSLGQNARQSVSIAISLGYCDITETCERGFDHRNVCKAQVGYQSN
eukprot:2087535-Pleurochrysis_carterae.AAC.1